MKDMVRTIECPHCATENNYLRARCNECNTLIGEIYQLKNRVFELERGAFDCLEKGAFVDAFRAFSVLLEYKPNSFSYLQGLCRACIGIRQIEKAKEYYEMLVKRKSKDSDLEKLRTLIF